MANVKSARKQKRKKIFNIIVIILLFILLLYISYGMEDEQQENSTEIVELQEITDDEPIADNQEAQNIEGVEGELILTMIDVGQADCFLLEQNGETALIDCGTRSTGKDAVEYLKSIGITRLDYVFGTHPHDDHMGGMYDIITNFEIGKVIIPEVTDDITTNWYIKLMTELNTGDYIVEYPEVGNEYYLGDATMKVIGPLSKPNGNLNNYSTVLKVTFGDMDIMMTGDAEKEVEKEILQTDECLDSEILKMGHHGSDTSSSEEFLSAVSPEYALISCKVGNKYNHPVKSTMEELEKREIPVYRTDENGTVIATITPTDVTFNCDPGDYLSGPELEEKEGK